MNKQYEAMRKKIEASIKQKAEEREGLQTQLTKTDLRISELETEMENIKADGSLEDYTAVAISLSAAKEFRNVICSRIEALNHPTKADQQQLEEIKEFIQKTHSDANKETLVSVKKISKEITDLFEKANGEATKLNDLYSDYASACNANMAFVVRAPGQEVLFKNFLIAVAHLNRAVESGEVETFTGIKI